MKKFNPEKEIAKVGLKRKTNNSSKLSNLFVPILVVACSCMAMTAVAFSAFLEEDVKEAYKIHLDIINGDLDTYDKTVIEGGFSDTITSKNSFGSIECTSGSLNYDPVTQTISSPYINRNTSCVLVFMDDGIKTIESDGLTKIGDNKGTGYYYKADAENNYILVKGMLFRIIRINGDGSLRIMLNDSVLTTNYGGNNKYLESNVKVVLDDWFTKNFQGESYLVETDFDITNYESYTTNDLVNLEGYYNSYVGTLSVREISLITRDTETNFINTSTGIYLNNGNGLFNVYSYQNNGITNVNPSETLNVRPVISVQAKLVGNGTKNNPYTISE